MIFLNQEIGHGILVIEVSDVIKLQALEEKHESRFLPIGIVWSHRYIESVEGELQFRAGEIEAEFSV